MTNPTPSISISVVVVVNLSLSLWEQVVGPTAAPTACPSPAPSAPTAAPAFATPQPTATSLYVHTGGRRPRGEQKHDQHLLPFPQVPEQASELPKRNPRCVADGNELLRFHCTSFSCSVGSADGTCLCHSDALDAYLPHADPRNAARALATLELLGGLESGCGALLGNPSAVRALVKMVFRVSSDHRGSEHAVGTLLSVCRSSGRARVEAVNAGALTQLLLLLQSQCSSKAKEKTRALLKLLSSMWV